jgi:hypothetical protein
LTQVQGVLAEQHSATEQKKIACQAKWDEEKEQLKKGKEQFIVEQLAVKEAVNRSLHSVIVVKIRVENQVTKKVDQLVEAIQ